MRRPGVQAAPQTELQVAPTRLLAQATRVAIVLTLIELVSAAPRSLAHQRPSTAGAARPSSCGRADPSDIRVANETGGQPLFL